MRCEIETEAAIERYADIVYRISILYLRNYADTEDLFQTVFLKYALNTTTFESPEHEKAWMIRVTVNACKDMLRQHSHLQFLPLSQFEHFPTAIAEDYSDVLEAVRSLPEKYRHVVYLHYYEGYSAPEIGKILGKNPNTIYTHLTRARQLLRQKLGGNGYE